MDSNGLRNAIPGAILFFGNTTKISNEADIVALRPLAVDSPFRNDRVNVLICWRATAKKLQRFRAGVPQLVFQAGRNGDCVTGLHRAFLRVNPYPARAGGDEINLLRARMVMLLRAAAHGQPRFRQALIANH